jgi:putative DNA primase/helicase
MSDVLYDPFVDPAYLSTEPADLDHLLDADPLLAAERPVLRTMTLDQLDELADPSWLIHGILPADAFAILFGPPGSTKSFWALEAACSVASGGSMHGSQVEAGKVIIAVGEGLRGIKLRVEAWRLANPHADHEALRNNLLLIPQAVQLLDADAASALVNTCEVFAGEDGLQMLIVDTWARALVGGDENSAQDAGVAIDVCERVRSRTGATVLVVHHTGADGTRERGSTALRGAADATYLMARDETTGEIKLTFKKMKDHDTPPPKTYVLKQFGHSAVLQQTIATAAPTQRFSKPAATGGRFQRRDAEFF